MPKTWLLAGLVVAAFAAQAQDANITFPVADLERTLAYDPFTIVSAEISRPKARGDITLKAEVSFEGRPPIRVKLRKAEPGADDFNNQPRYDIAAYRLQAMFLDPPDYVIPPTALRFVPVAEFSKYSRDVDRTFIGVDEVLAVLQYWLQEVKVVEDVLSPTLYAADPVYARHVEQLNVLTWLIDHGDSNLGNFLISRTEQGPRVFAVDNGVAFASSGSDRGRLWDEMRVSKLPAATVERLRRITAAGLEAELGVVAQWRQDGNRYVPVQPGPNLRPARGVRRVGDDLQLGLTTAEIEKVRRNLERLLAMIDDGSIKTY